MQTTAIGSTSGIQATAAPEKTGFASLTADDFMRMLIVELQNQDPTEPMGNDALLNQLSTMQNLQANVELTSSLTAFTASQQLSSAANFIGKTVTGTAGGIGNQDIITGSVESAFLKDGKIYLGIDGKEVPFSSVNAVKEG